MSSNAGFSSPSARFDRTSIQINYYPFHMRFCNGDLEKAFISYFHAQHIKNDIVWSIAVGFFCLAIGKRFLVVNDSRMVWQYVFSMSTLIITDIVGGRISLYYPRTYLATRQPLTWIRVLLRLAFSLAYLPRKAFYYLRLTDPPHTHFEFLSILFKVCFLNSLSALGYVLPSFAQIGIAVGCIITSMTSVLTTCNLPALPELEVERQAMHVDLGTWINGCVQRLLPLELGKEEWLPMVHESSCSLVSSWAFATFALAGSLIVSNWNEERLRREFLALEGYFIFMPMVGWQVLHAAVQMAMAAQILWVLLSAVSLWRIIIL